LSRVIPVLKEDFMRIRLIAALTAALVLALSAVAHAARITGGTTTITPSAAATKLLSDNGITVSALKPATLGSDGAVTIPIRNGHIRLKAMRGFVRHKGGIALTDGSTTFKLRRPAVVLRKHHTFIVAAVRRNNRPWHIRRVARLTDLQRTGTTATATVHITRVVAKAVNALAGKHVVNPGAVLGTGSSTVTVAAKK
jgi:ribosomal protein L18E